MGHIDTDVSVYVSVTIQYTLHSNLSQLFFEE